MINEEKIIKAIAEDKWIMDILKLAKRDNYDIQMLNNRAPLDIIQNLLGQEKSMTTKIYAQLSGILRWEL